MVTHAAVVENRRAKLLEPEEVKGPPSVQIEDANVLGAPLLHHREMAAVTLPNPVERKFERDKLLSMPFCLNPSTSLGSVAEAYDVTMRIALLQVTSKIAFMLGLLRIPQKADR